MKFSFIAWTISLIIFQNCESNNAAPVMKNIHNREIVYSYYKDPRDHKTYKVLELNGLAWFNENLKFDTLKSIESDCITMDSCDWYGNMYTLTIAEKACPTGWRLPTDNEWALLESNFGMDSTEIIRTGIMRGIETNEIFYQKNVNDFNIKFNGSATFINRSITHKNNNHIAGYWTSTLNRNADSIWVRIFYPASNIARVKLDVNKDSSLFYIRCVRKKADHLENE